MLQTPIDLKIVDYTTKKTVGRPDGPLVFTFHGTGSNENQFHGLVEQLTPRATIISPRGDVLENGVAQFFRTQADGDCDRDDLARRTEEMATWLADMRARNLRRRTIGLGFSSGATILAAILVKYPDIFDAVALLHPNVSWKPADNRGLRNRKVLIAAGKNDPASPPARTEALISYFSRQGSRTIAHWHAGGQQITEDELSVLRRFLTKG